MASAGNVTLSVRYDVRSIAEVEGEAGWSAGATTATDAGTAVELASDEGAVTLSARVRATGDIVADITTRRQRRCSAGAAVHG